MQWLEAGVASIVSIGPFLDKTDGRTPETGLSPVAYLARNGGASVARDSSDPIVHDRDGYYKVPLSAVDVGSVGDRLRVHVSSPATHLAVWEDFRIVELG